MAPNPSLKSASHLLNGEAKLVRKQQEDDEGFVSAMQMVSSTVLSMAMQSAVDLGVFDVMAKAGEGGKLSAKEIADKICSKNPEASIMLDGVLRLLASRSVVDCSLIDDEGGKGSKGIIRLYSLTPMSRYFATDADGVSFGPLITLIQDKIFLESWSQMKGAIMEGGVPFNGAHSMHALEYPRQDQRFNEVFNKAMFNSTILLMKKILESYNGFDRTNRLVDVGGGLGVNLEVYTGVKHVGGGMFESVPKGDAIFMKWILHDWSDKHCLKLLKNCYNAIPDDGKVIIVDAVLPVMPETITAVKFAMQGDVLMMTQNPGGKERTEQDFIELATAAGFTGVTFVNQICGIWVFIQLNEHNTETRVGGKTPFLMTNWQGIRSGSVIKILINLVSLIGFGLLVLSKRKRTLYMYAHSNVIY